YKVVELNTNALNYTYDAAEYTVIVDVTTDADNKLVATVDIQKDAAAANEIEFTNKYEVPVVPVAPANPTAPKTSNKPNTGDDAGNLIMMLSMFAASVGLLGAVSYKRKLNK
ncbi:MAG: LPXTG cell wall anchor domain-containing protein, partial [[Eubacterium] sulci]|nr:LPXTG cell wall anchor domain-containing protein [[Eubacterium] sulci]MBF1600393.1 LPXTG cell wall anchor domain-containing protein [Prevotella sp.]